MEPKYSYNGETKTLEEWGKALGITKQGVLERIKNGWPDAKVFTTQSGTWTRTVADGRKVKYHIRPGSKNGTLTVIKEIPASPRTLLCRCQCGRQVTINLHHFTNPDRIVSCDHPKCRQWAKAFRAAGKAMDLEKASGGKPTKSPPKARKPEPVEWDVEGWRERRRQRKASRRSGGNR